MHPILFNFDFLGRSHPIGTYGIFLLVAMIAGFFIPRYLAKKSNYDQTDISLYSIILISAGLCGALITGFILFLPERLAATTFWMFPFVLVSWGGILGGISAAVLLKIFFKIHFLNLADLVAPAYLMAIGLGRIGCHFGGCCFGIHTDSWIGITFTDPLAPASTFQAQPLIPTQLISALFLISASLIFIKITLRRKVPGVTFFLSVLVYSMFRFTIEYWRADMRKFFIGLSDGQIFSLIMYSIAIIGLIYVNKHKERLMKTIKHISS